ncbi:MAG: hypothetical protein Q4A72_01880 [Bacillota bacterium]|nr:hypothetical protein [Bacillota bacterium]
MDTEPSSRIVSGEEELLNAIRKHPYFKNPCKYPIRIISIMKYLKKKGFDVKEKDIDLKVDELISQLPDVTKVDFGLYKIVR